MVAQSYGCDESRLKSFLDDELPEREHARIGDHLETCAGCRRTLERLAAGSRLWDDLRDLRADQGPLPRSAPGAGATEILAKSPQDGPAADPDRPLDFLAASDSPGSLGRLGPYEVTDVLGRGGFGVVLKASDPTLGRAVAIKVLAPELATSAAARSRFAREARAAAAVVHDHVVAIHAVDSWDGLPYLVMPYIAGCSVQERVDRDGPMHVKEVLRVGTQTAQGLAAAHAQGLVHRDVKPSNILLENGVERVKLTDFGLARAVDDASLTQSGVVAGTPQYMSPEQARGDAVDHRSDLFSLGSVLYFMCVGHPPFRASSTPAVLRRVSDEQPRSIREVNPDVPPWLAELVERLHAKDPAQRFESATEVAEIMGRYLAALQRGLPVGATRPRPLPPAPRRPGRKTAIAAVLGIPAIALALVPAEKRNRALDHLFFRTPHVERDHLAAFAMDAGAALPVNAQDPQEQPIIGSGNPAVKDWDITGFTSLEIGSTFRAQIFKGTRFKVTTTADDNVLPFVRVSKVGTTLKIGLEPGRSFQLKKPLEVEIMLPTLKELAMGGASRGTLDGFQSEKEFQLKLGGVSKLDGSMTVEKADFHVDGASTLSLVGAASTARLSAGGASHLKLGEFALKACEIGLDGASTARLAVRSDSPFKARVSGISHLTGAVEAKDVDIETDGASQVALGGTAADAKTRPNDTSSRKTTDLSLDAHSVKIVASGTSSVKLRGRTEAAVLEASGASHLDLKDLTAKTAEVELSGVSHAMINATVSLNYTLTSGSHLRYLGNPPTLHGTTSGGARISPGK